MQNVVSFLLTVPVFETTTDEEDEDEAGPDGETSYVCDGPFLEMAMVVPPIKMCS